jgi:hypothetical protein
MLIIIILLCRRIEMFRKVFIILIAVVRVSFATSQDLIGKNFIDFYGKDESGKVV